MQVFPQGQFDKAILTVALFGVAVPRTGLVGEAQEKRTEISKSGWSQLASFSKAGVVCLLCESK